MTTAPFTRIYRPGKFRDYDGRKYDVFVKVDWNGKRLSITGVEGPKDNGNAHGSCGQIHPLKLVDVAPLWEWRFVKRLNEIWDRWHLNDMRAGSPAQEAWLTEHKGEFGTQHDFYMWASTHLADAGLNPDPETGYTYGHKWLTEEVPDEVLLDLLAYPEADKHPAWV